LQVLDLIANVCEGNDADKCSDIRRGKTYEPYPFSQICKNLIAICELQPMQISPYISLLEANCCCDIECN